MTERPTIDFPDTTRTATDADSSPTIHKAVALAHDRESGDTPRIVASGKGFVAERYDQILRKGKEGFVRAGDEERAGHGST